MRRGPALGIVNGLLLVLPIWIGVWWWIFLRDFTR